MIVSKIIKITQSRELSRKIVKCSRETDIIYDMTIMMKLAHPGITQFDVNNLITGWRREFNLANSVRMHEAASKQAFQAAVKFRKANRLKQAGGHKVSLPATSASGARNRSSWGKRKRTGTIGGPSRPA